VDTLAEKRIPGVFKVAGDIYTTGNVNISSNSTPPETQTPLKLHHLRLLTVDSYALVKINCI
jgi:hypothetical protein